MFATILFPIYEYEMYKTKKMHRYFCGAIGLVEFSRRDSDVTHVWSGD